MDDYLIILGKYTGNDVAVMIPDSITTVGERAFAGNTLIEEVVIPEGVRGLDEGCFDSCTSLSRVQMPDSLWRIGKAAFPFPHRWKSI